MFDIVTSRGYTQLPISLQVQRLKRRPEIPKRQKRHAADVVIFHQALAEHPLAGDFRLQRSQETKGYPTIHCSEDVAP